MCGRRRLLVRLLLTTILSSLVLIVFFHGFDSSSPSVSSTISATQPSLAEILASVEFLNSHSLVLNERQFDGPINSLLAVVVVQVHNRATYLRLLIESLRMAVHIDRVLLIFSHDFYSSEINDLVRSIDFTRVIQIFYPYSQQLNPNHFPGEDPDDCPSDISVAEAKIIRCKNWQYPDKYGHYRMAGLTQIKQHWWWKMNYVFDGIPLLADFNGYTLLLEEDHYVSPDFLHVFQFIIENKAYSLLLIFISLCPSCHAVALGAYLKEYKSYENDMDRLAVYPWFSSRHNLGMAFDRNTWTGFRNCSQLFCTYDDYNWDWTMMHINSKCLSAPLSVLQAKASRVFHIGDCGVHSHKCLVDSSANQVAELLDRVKHKLFPFKLEVVERSQRVPKKPKENGGWGDVRDHQLCSNNTRWPKRPNHS